MLTLDEYRDSAMLVSLFSYASNGDLVEHFTRVPVGDIVKSKNTKAQREIGSLRSRGMTCMTQAFDDGSLSFDVDTRGESFSFPYLSDDAPFPFAPEVVRELLADC
jgi:hypothetical protein